MFYLQVYDTVLKEKKNQKDYHSHLIPLIRKEIQPFVYGTSISNTCNQNYSVLTTQKQEVLYPHLCCQSCSLLQLPV